jgi:pro-apoptotic serine protease NMA111
MTLGIFLPSIAYNRFLKFDPSKVKYMEVRALPLRPDLAKVGVEIRVVG